MAGENATTMRVAGVKEGNGSKPIAMATRVAGKQTVFATTRAMLTKTKEAGEEEGNGKGSKSDGNGKKDSNGKRW